MPAEVDPADLDEVQLPGELPRVHVGRLAAAKARLVAGRHPDAIVLAADTIVVAGRRILPKADDVETARRCLTQLSGRRHHVMTAVAVVAPDGRLRERLSDTTVTFKPLTVAEIDDYIATGEWAGKAGGYAIQGRAEAFVRALAGSHSGVIGLPLYETRNLLMSSGLPS